MVRSARSITLESELWLTIEKFAKERGFDNLSTAIEHLIRRGLEIETEKVKR